MVGYLYGEVKVQGRGLHHEPEGDEWHEVIELVSHVHGQAKHPDKQVHP